MTHVNTKWALLQTPYLNMAEPLRLWTLFEFEPIFT